MLALCSHAQRMCRENCYQFGVRKEGRVFIQVHFPCRESVDLGLFKFPKASAVCPCELFEVVLLALNLAAFLDLTSCFGDGVDSIGVD